MPSSPGSNPRHHALPWFLDPLRWIGPVSNMKDRAAIDMVRADLADDLRELLEAGVPRRQAYRKVWRRAKLESAFFLPRAWQHRKARAAAAWSRAGRRARRIAKPAMGVAAVVLVLLSAKWFFLDRWKMEDFAKASRQVVLMTEQLRADQQRLDRLTDSTRNSTEKNAIPQEAHDVILRLREAQDYFERTRQAFPGEFYLTGWIGLVDEGLADFWSACGDETKSEYHRRAALSSYARGVGEGDPISMYQLGAWYLDQGEVHRALPYLRRAHQEWPRVAPDGGTTGHVAAEYHWALFELWKAEHSPAYAAEARRLEEEALRDARNGNTKEMTYQILYNAACLRTLMIQDGVLDAGEGFQLIELLNTVLSVAGDSTVHIARVMLSDHDLDSLRTLPAFESVASRARSIVEADSPNTGR